MTKKQHNLKVTDEQLSIINNALEAYSRAHTGQFDIWFEETFAHGIGSKTVNELDWEDKQNLNNLMQFMILKKETGFHDYRNNGSFGIYNQDIDPSAFKAWQISKVIQEFLSVKNNDGYWGTTRNFDGPMGDNPPEIEGFKDYKDFDLPQSIQDKLHVVLCDRHASGFGAWELVDDYIPNDLSYKNIEIVNTFLTNGEPKDMNDFDKPYEYKLRVYKPVKEKTWDEACYELRQKAEEADIDIDDAEYTGD